MNKESSPDTEVKYEISKKDWIYHNASFWFFNLAPKHENWFFSLFRGKTKVRKSLLAISVCHRLLSITAWGSGTTWDLHCCVLNQLRWEAFHVLTIFSSITFIWANYWCVLWWSRKSESQKDVLQRSSGSPLRAQVLLPLVFTQWGKC